MVVAAPLRDRRQSLRLGWARLRSHIKRGLDARVPGPWGDLTLGALLLRLYIAWEILSWALWPIVLWILL